MKKKKMIISQETMDVDFVRKVEALSGTSVQVSEAVTAPVIAKRSAQSRVAIRGGQTVVIDGGWLLT